MGYFGFRLSQLTRFDDVSVEEAEAGEPANYLIVGSDSREKISEDDPDAGNMLEDEAGGQRSDTIMLLRIDPEEEDAYLLSFPRDLYLPLAGDRGSDKINAAYAQGRQVLIDTIQQNFDLQINHYVEIDFVAFRDIVDEIGGVPLYFERPVRDKHTGLAVPEPGCHLLDGRSALHFARSRYLQYQDEDGDWRSDPTADLGRITRQQVFIRRALTAAVNAGFSNPVKLNGVLSALVPKVGVDENLDAGDIVSLARRFEDFDAENLETFSLPTSSDRSPAGASVEMLQEDEAEPMLNIFRGLPPGTISPSSVTVQVVNGTGVAGQAAEVSTALTDIGFEVVEPASLEERYTRTTVRFGEGADTGARLVARHVTGGAALVPDPELDEGEVVLVTGADLTTLHTQPSPEGHCRRSPLHHVDLLHLDHQRGVDRRRGDRGGVDHDEHDRGRLLDRRATGRNRVRLAPAGVTHVTQQTCWACACSPTESCTPEADGACPDEWCPSRPRRHSLLARRHDGRRRSGRPPWRGARRRPSAPLGPAERALALRLWVARRSRPQDRRDRAGRPPLVGRCHPRPARGRPGCHCGPAPSLPRRRPSGG